MKDLLMQWKMNPAALIGIVAAALSVFSALGFTVTPDLKEAIQGLAVAIVGALAIVLTRSQVSPVAKIEAAFGPGSVQAVAEVTTSEVRESEQAKAERAATEPEL